MSNVLDHVDTPIGAEHWGLTRALRRQVEREDHAFNCLINDLDLEPRFAMGTTSR
jgi:hypothetical protein